MGLVLFTISLVRKKCIEVPEPYDRTKPDRRGIRHKSLQIVVPDLNKFLGQLGLQSVCHRFVLRRCSQIGELLRISGCVKQLDPAGSILVVLNVGPLVLAEQKSLSRRRNAEGSVANRERRVVEQFSRYPCPADAPANPAHTNWRSSDTDPAVRPDCDKPRAACRGHR